MSLPPHYPPKADSNKRLWLLILSRSSIAAGALLLLVIAGSVVWGWIFVNQRLAPLVERNLEQILGRPVNIGTVERFSFNSLRFSSASVPATPTDPDRLTADALEVQFDPSSLLFNRRLELNITLVEPDAYIEQAKNGQWVSTKIKTPEGGAGFLQTELETIRVRDGDLVLVPNLEPGRPKGTVAIADISGIARFLDQNQRLEFELTGQPKTGGKLAIAGQTRPAASQQTTLNIEAQNLLATEISRLIDLPINLQSGRVSGDLIVQLQPEGQPAIAGTASLSNVTAKIANVPNVFTNTQGKLVFQSDRTIALNNVTTRYGKIPLQIGGTLNTQKGYNLSGQVKAVSVNNVLDTLNVNSPFPAQGTVRADIQLTGKIAKPVLSGTISTIKTAQIDRIPFKNISSRFQLTTAQATPEITFANIQATPTVGGKITGKGQIQLQAQPQISFNFQGQNLPGNAVAKLYGTTPEITIGDVSATATISGSPGNIRTVAQLQAPEATYPTRAKVILTDEGNTLIRDAVVQVAGGTVTANGQINRDRQFQAVVNASGVQLDSFSPQLRGELSANNLRVSGNSFELANIQAQGQVRFSQGLAAIAQPLVAQVRWNGEQIIVQNATAPGINASGTVAVSLPEQANPQITGLNLDVQVQDYDLQDLGLNIPGNVALAGQADFTGKVSGTPDAPNAVGNLRLQNLRVNNLAFDSVLTGNLNYRSRMQTQLELSGEEDRIALTLNQNNRPVSFFVRRNQAIASGTTQDGNLVVDVRDFPIAVLRNVIPGDRLANVNTIAGDISGKLVIDLAENIADSTVVGDLAISRPRVGTFAADRLQARFRYQEGAFALTESELQQGESRIALSGDLQAGNDKQFQFQIDFDSAKIENILQALTSFGVADLAGELLPENLPKAETLQTVPVGLPEKSLLAQLRRFSEIETLLAQQQQQQSASPLPTLAELDGTASGQIVVSGSLQPGQQPAFNVSFDLLGQDWEWGDNITIDEVVAQGTYDNGVLTLLPLRVDLCEGAIAFTGQLGEEQLAGQLQVESLPVAQIEPFLPPQFDVQVAGNLNALVNLSGSLANPTARGEVDLVEGSVNRQPIENAQLSFSYDDARLNFDSTLLVQETQPVAITGSIPLALPFASIQADSDRISIQANVQDEGLALLNLFTNRVAWVKGEGQVNVEVQGTLDQPIVMGEAIVKNATFKAEALPKPLTDVTGTVEFNGDRIFVPGITAQYNASEVTARGTIPIFATQTTQQLASANPLTVSFNNLDINVAERYRGKVSGDLAIAGTALSPSIGGRIRLSNGQVSLAGTQDPPTSATTIPGSSTVTASSPIRLSNLQLILGDDVRIVRQPLLNFAAEGDLTINGTLANPRPQGVVRLVRGQINLFTTQFNLARGEQQTARFTPKGGLNPILDVTLVATVPEATAIGQVQTAPASGEIRDLPATSLGTFRTVRVEASVAGPVSELADNLELTSEPGRTQAEIVNLLGGSFINTLGRGDAALGFATIAGSTILSNFQGNITQLGQSLGIDELRLFPTIVTDPAENVSVLGLAAEAVFDITDELSLSLVRVFAADDPLRYNLLYRFNDEVLVRASTNLSGESRVLVEYETKF